MLLSAQHEASFGALKYPVETEKSHIESEARPLGYGESPTEEFSNFPHMFSPTSEVFRDRVREFLQPAPPGPNAPTHKSHTRIRTAPRFPSESRN